EGDGRAPAGAFKLVEATGYAAAPPAGTTLKYRQATDTLRCVDDPKSKLYNQLVDEKIEPKTWASAEDMRRADTLYTWVILVAPSVQLLITIGRFFADGVSLTTPR